MIIYSLMMFRTKYFGNLMGLLLVSALTFTVVAIFKAGKTTTGIISNAVALGLLVFPCIIPFFLIYLRSLRIKDKLPRASIMWTIIPVVLCAGCLLVDMSVGNESIRALLTTVRYHGPFGNMPAPGSGLRVYFVWVFLIGFSVIAIEMVILMTHILYRFVKDGWPEGGIFTLLKGGDASVCKIQMEIIFTYTIFVVLGFVLPTLFTAIVLAVHILAFFYVGLFSVRETISLKEMRNAFLFNYRDENRSEIVSEMMSMLLDDAGAEMLDLYTEKTGTASNGGLLEDARPAFDVENDNTVEDGDGTVMIPALSSRFFSSTENAFHDNSLVNRFEKLLINEKLFLSPSLTLVDIADRLNTNKTYISKLVNSTYNAPFPDFVNTLRVDYAEKYIVEHRDAKQHEIAKACGFQSASTFNNTFKRITGVTPKIWLATFDSQNAQLQTIDEDSIAEMRDSNKDEDSDKE